MTQLLIKYGNIALTTTTMHRVRYHLYLLFLVRLGGYTVNLSDFYSYRLVQVQPRFFLVEPDWKPLSTIFTKLTCRGG